MGRLRTLRFHDAFSEFEYNNSMTTYRGEKMTIARARALKAAESRKKKQENADKEVKTAIMDEVMDCCKDARAIRMLKSIRAYARNGEQQWGIFFKRFLAQNRSIKAQLYKFCTLYDELDAIEKDIKKHLRKDARYALNLVEKYGYRLQDLLETVQKFGDSVSKSQASDMPMWKNHEIIKGSADGKRVGLKRIMGQMVSACKKMEKSIRTLAVKQKSAYEEICDKQY